MPAIDQLRKGSFNVVSAEVVLNRFDLNATTEIVNSSVRKDLLCIILRFRTVSGIVGEFERNRSLFGKSP